MFHVTQQRSTTRGQTTICEAKCYDMTTDSVQHGTSISCAHFEKQPPMLAHHWLRSRWGGVDDHSPRHIQQWYIRSIDRAAGFGPISDVHCFW